MGFQRKYTEENASARQAIHQAYTSVFRLSGSVRNAELAERLFICTIVRNRQDGKVLESLVSATSAVHHNLTKILDNLLGHLGCLYMSVSDIPK